MQPSFPQITLFRTDDETNLLPNTYPTGKKRGSVNPKEVDGRICDELNVKCTISYNDIFGNSESFELSGVNNITGISGIVYKSEAYNVKITDSSGTAIAGTSVKRGDVIDYSLNDWIYFTTCSCDCCSAS